MTIRRNSLRCEGMWSIGLSAELELPTPSGSTRSGAGSARARSAGAGAGLADSNMYGLDQKIRAKHGNPCSNIYGFEKIQSRTSLPNFRSRPYIFKQGFFKKLVFRENKKRIWTFFLEILVQKTISFSDRLSTTKDMRNMKLRHARHEIETCNMRKEPFLTPAQSLQWGKKPHKIATLLGMALCRSELLSDQRWCLNVHLWHVSF